MKKKNEVFFGTHGLTSTSANHMANIAKERIAANEAKLSNVTFVTTTIDIVGSNAVKGKTISLGYTKEQLAEVEGLLEDIGAMHSFCAWVREAIKAKDEETQIIEDKDISEWEKENGMEPLEGVEDKFSNDFPDEDDILGEMNIKERNEYFRLEAYAAAIGKFIHNGGSLTSAREALHVFLMKPFSTEGKGADTVIYAHNPSVPAEEVDTVFFELQKKHRENERELNRIKYDIRNKLSQKRMDYFARKRAYIAEWKEERDRRDNLFKAWKLKETDRISQLKIVIPEALQPIYNLLKEMEK